MINLTLTILYTITLPKFSALHMLFFFLLIFLCCR
jgi:hypothetical protein